MKTIGVLTSGGDAPGMNAAVRSIVRSAEAMGIKVKGVMRGYNGLIENHFVDLDIRSVSDIIQRGGTALYTGARDLSLRGIPCVGILATIDNDISSTNYTIGFDTAMNTVVELVDKIRDTACSHDRCSVVEVMGHGAGDLALQCGLAVGATSVIVPEKTYDPEAVITKIRETQKIGKKSLHYRCFRGTLRCQRACKAD